jgi:hypothetical protein
MNQTRSAENWKGQNQTTDLFLRDCMCSSYLVYRLVAEAAAGKSKHHQMQAEARAAAKAKLREQVARGEKVPSGTAVTP